MDKYTEHAYVYRHDGGEYIGCRAMSKSGNGYDCTRHTWSNVDCTRCKYADGGNAHENNLSRHRAHNESI